MKDLDICPSISKTAFYANRETEAVKHIHFFLKMVYPPKAIPAAANAKNIGVNRQCDGFTC